ncbi:hypothetical protein B0J12DRAFT_686655 [Macrophomina phaseolina]|uniref:Secreted protein n=1 Tax=Macrophomina phaseolina TaxID=35725 RepID=A0ABQ8FT90_9PEZI|nr:hypothetical protein B0J12DRAFT_686655 [Macrophomina phaseolina]
MHAVGRLAFSFNFRITNCIWLFFLLGAVHFSQHDWRERESNTRCRHLRIRVQIGDTDPARPEEMQFSRSHESFNRVTPPVSNAPRNWHRTAGRPFGRRMQRERARAGDDPLSRARCRL